MARIQIYTTAWCGYCVRAKALLDAKGIAYEEIRLDDDPAFRQKLLELTGGWTVPQILLDGEPIGGYTELWQLDKTGRLVGVDVPHARERPLVEQCSLDRRSASPESLGEPRHREGAFEGLATNPDREVVVELVGAQHEPRAEAADVVVRDVRSVV